MKKLLIFPFVIFLFSCNQHPKDGDVYENKLTRERVKIDVGKCYSLVNTQEKINEIEKEVEDSLRNAGNDDYSALDYGMFKSIQRNYDDSTNTCVGYDDERDTITFYEITEVSEFEQDFTLIK